MLRKFLYKILISNIYYFKMNVTKTYGFVNTEAKITTNRKTMETISICV